MIIVRGICPWIIVTALQYGLAGLATARLVFSQILYNIFTPYRQKTHKE